MIGLLAQVHDLSIETADMLAREGFSRSLRDVGRWRVTVG